VIQTPMFAWIKLARPGFSLIEILVALMIIGGLIAMVPRMLSGPRPLEQAWTQINTMFTRAQLESVTQGSIHRIFIQVPADGPIELMIQAPDPHDPTNNATYRTLAESYAHARLPAGVTISRCIIDGIDEMQVGILTSCWIFVYANGTTQPSLLTLTNQDTGQARSLKLHPLYVMWQPQAD
jgi:prepilin-type N-terminal cleavage/methylation domain-containing protein